MRQKQTSRCAAAASASGKYTPEDRADHVILPAVVCVVFCPSLPQIARVGIPHWLRWGHTFAAPTAVREAEWSWVEAIPLSTLTPADEVIE